MKVSLKVETLSPTFGRGRSQDNSGCIFLLGDQILDWIEEFTIWDARRSLRLNPMRDLK